jgi:heme A synthase
MRLVEHFKSLSSFAKFAWFVVAYNILVIMWGAFVRASKSGDGCGNHYPLCDGSNLVPLNPTIATVIEFLHRVTTGLDGIIVLALVIWAFYAFAKRHRVRRAAVLSFVFILTEGAIGAGLVLFELVAENKSLARAVSMSAHLVNTLILLLFLSLTAWFASGGKVIRIRENARRALFLGLGLLLVALVGMSGAVAALGNTLFPGRELSEALNQPDVPLLVKAFVWLEIWHPFLSVVTSIYLIAVVQPLRSARNSAWIKRFANGTLLLIGAQMIFGTLNLVFLAPIWMQLVHLLLAELMWIALVLLFAAALAEPKFAYAANENFAQKTV